MVKLSKISIPCVILAMFILGCGGDGNPKRPTGSGSVSGCVTHKEKPVVDAKVTFVNSDGVSKEAKTDNAGNYTIESMPAGPYMVGIAPVNPRDLPGNYSSPSDSGLLFTVLAGKNQADFKL